jgi:ribosome maturation factor RimP
MTALQAGQGMALQIDTIRAMAERVAASHHLEVVDVEFVGGGKARTLRVYLEKDAAERAKLKERLASGEDLELPKGVPIELLSGVTHEDCAEFARDFGTLLDVEDVVPGSEYTLEVSSPGLERSLKRAEEYERFVGSLVKVKTFVPVNGGKVWTGRLTGFSNGTAKIDLAAVKQKRKKANKDQGTGNNSDSGSILEIPLRDIEKANLVAEI